MVRCSDAVVGTVLRTDGGAGQQEGGEEILKMGAGEEQEEDACVKHQLQETDRPGPESGAEQLSEDPSLTKPSSHTEHKGINDADQFKEPVEIEAEPVLILPPPVL